MVPFSVTTPHRMSLHGRWPFLRVAIGMFITDVHVLYDGFSTTHDDGHLDLSTAKQSKSFSATSLPPPWGDDIFVMDFLSAGGCEKEVKTALDGMLPGRVNSQILQFTQNRHTENFMSFWEKVLAVKFSHYHCTLQIHLRYYLQVR